LRKIAATVLALPIVAIILLSALVRRPGFVKLGLMAGAIGILATGLLFTLPAQDASGQTLPTFAPLAPQAEPRNGGTNLALDAPFQVQFTKPMNESTVEANVQITPNLPVKFRWDGTGQILSILPASHWAAQTQYQVLVGQNATDQEGLVLSKQINMTFESGSTTAGTITATQMVGDQISPATAFQVTFTRPVKLASVLLNFWMRPQVPVTVVGDDPTDGASQVFTMTPKDTLDSATSYVIGFADGVLDSSGSAISPIKPITVSTLEGPAVVRFRPLDGTSTSDTNQPISVRFTVAMDTRSTAAAFSVTMNGKALGGSVSWTEGNTVLVFNHGTKLVVGSTVVARVSTNARSAAGMRLTSASTATFGVKAPTVSAISYGGGGTVNAKWKASEVYYFALMNCTRKGGWVTRSGSCSTETHHTLPAQNALILDSVISDKVSRRYAQYMADRRILDHYAYHDPGWRLCNWGGYCSKLNGENIASPSTSGQAGMIDIEIFYQNEYWCRCEHYLNIMYPYFHRAGVGVWVSSTSGRFTVRVSIDFN